MTVAASPSIPFSVYVRSDSDEQEIAQAAGWELVATEEPWDGPGTQLCLRATWQGNAPVQAGIVVRRRLTGTPPYWIMVPGLFYGDNGTGSPSTRYPRLGPLDHAQFTSPAWDFASERTPLPAAFALSQNKVEWVAVEPGGTRAGTGIGFSLAENDPYLSMHYPGLERPFKHDRLDETPFEPFIEIAPGENLELRLWYGEQPTSALTAFAEVQRALQSAWADSTDRVNVSAALAAADAAVDGLLRWHYRVEQGNGVLMETVSFDGAQVRDEMHVAWVSGAPTAYALLRHGLTRGDERALVAARSVLDTVAGGLAPCGAFWGIWTPHGWRAGWNGGPTRLHSRTLAEATLFMVRALALEPDHPEWTRAVRSNLEFCLRSMDEHGNPGSYYDAYTGEVLDRQGTAGLLWAAALAEAAGVLDSPDYMEAALRVGTAYSGALRRGELLGAPEDIGLCPSSEDAYNALIATMALANATHSTTWLDLARVAADWLLTYRWSYDVRFTPGSPLARRDFRTRGADLASPSNNHLHMYGLICQQELFELSTLLRDPWYGAQASAHLACFVGEIALRNGQFGGAEQRGMVAEQWYTVGWSGEGRAGEVSPVSHAWCLGLLLLACEEWADCELSSTPAPAHKDAQPQLSGVARIQAARRVREAALPQRDQPKIIARQRSIESPAASLIGKPHSVRLLPGFYNVGGGYLSHGRDAASYLLLDEATGEGILVDCGSHAGLDALRANIAQVADLNSIKLVIGTHCHWDHVEAFGHIREETDALFAIHALDARAVRTGDPDLTCAGFLYNDTFHPFPVDITLQGGEQFHIGDYDLEVLHLPGHTPGCIGVMLRYSGTGQTILIPGDSVLGAYSKRTSSSLPDWKRSIRKLMSQKIDLMVTNHLPPGSQTSLLADVPHRLSRVYSQLQTEFYSFSDPQWS